MEPAAQDGPPIDVPAYCRSRGIAYLETGPLDSADAVALRLGILNALMGLLPAHRGMNVPNGPRSKERQSAARCI